MRPQAAAWLHDITKGDGESHATSGASFAHDFLPQTDFPPEKINQVARAIADHKGLWRDEPLTELESMVLWDADKLSKIGLTAAFHWTGMALAGDRLTTMADLITSSHDVPWLEKAVASMHTEPARQAAQSRLEAYNLLYSDLEAELKGDDLATN
jgi:HD superfamily phosphodiesterase